MRAKLAEAIHAQERARLALEEAKAAQLARIDVAKAEVKQAEAKHAADLEAAHKKVVALHEQLSGLICMVEQVALYRDRLDLGVKSFDLTEDLKVELVSTGTKHKGPYKEPIRLGSENQSLKFCARNAETSFCVDLKSDHETSARNLAACVLPAIKAKPTLQATLPAQIKEAIRKRDLIEKDRYNISIALNKLKEIERDTAEVSAAERKYLFAEQRRYLIQAACFIEDKGEALWRKISSADSRHH